MSGFSKGQHREGLLPIKLPRLVFHKSVKTTEGTDGHNLVASGERVRGQLAGICHGGNHGGKTEDNEDSEESISTVREVSH